MELHDIVIGKLQDILGASYKLYKGNAFETKYTNSKTQDMDWNAFDKDKNIIPAIFTMIPTSYNVAPFTSYNTNYTLSFWVPLEVKTDKFGELIGTTPTDVYADYTSLRTALSNVTIRFTNDTVVEDVITAYGMRGLMTFSELTTSTAYDKTGTGKRVILTATGKINITNNGILASDRDFKFGYTDEGVTTYYTIDGIYNLSFGNNRNGSATQQQGTFLPTLDGESNENTISFTYDNYEDLNNPLLQYIENIAMGTSGSNTAFYLPIQIWRKGSKVAEFIAMISVTFNNPNGSLGIETVSVQLQRKE